VVAVRGVRARLTASLVALVALTAVVLGVGASIFVDTRLHQQALIDARDQATFDLTVIVPGRQLPDRPTVDDIDRSGLIETFGQRGVGTLIDLGDGTTRIETETLVAGTDQASTRRFRPYWALIRLPSGLIRRSWLAAIDRRACR